jgi:hypothetical protein
MEAIARTARVAGLTNVFNPSVASLANTTYVTFRAAPRPGHKPFHGYLLRLEPNREAVLTDLAETAGDIELSKLADPKLVTLGTDVYVTFNTGTVHSGENDIYLQRVSPVPGLPQRCLYDGRRSVEKNWGFFQQPGGELRVLYALAPFTVLRLTRGELGVSETLRFEAERSSRIAGEFPHLHIGSQPLLDGHDRALVLANERVKIPPRNYRKIYLGRLAELDLASGAVTRLSPRLMHSWRSMVPPQRERHNPVLWSATYFSGLTRADDELLVGYGVNDKSYGVARIAEASIWR